MEWVERPCLKSFFPLGGRARSRSPQRKSSEMIHPEFLVDNLCFRFAAITVEFRKLEEFFGKTIPAVFLPGPHGILD